MRKTSLLNSNISSVISKMGHTDMLAIGDCGLPIPKETERIDLALIKGIPGFIETLKAILEELQVEEVLIAKLTLSKALTPGKDFDTPTIFSIGVLSPIYYTSQNNSYLDRKSVV